MRKSPVVKGLETLVGRPVVRQALFGLALLVPAAAFIARVPELASGGTSVVDALSSDALSAEERARVDLVAGTWREQMDGLDATRSAVEDLAAEFKVPVDLAADIHEAAVTNEIDPRMAFGLVRAESRFRPTIVSPVGAVGLTQVMPATAKWLVPGTSKADLKDPETNLKVGFKYLRSLLDQYDGNRELALTAYNRGPGTVAKLLKRGRNPDNGYAEMVMTGKSAKHVSLMNAKFGSRHSVSKAKAKSGTKKFKASSVRRKG
jgi:soluble lytic murein transglycosylase-like protein